MRPVFLPSKQRQKATGSYFTATAVLQGVSWSPSVEQSKDSPLWTFQPQPLLLHCKTLEITILPSLRTLSPAPGTSAKRTSPASAVLRRLLKRTWSNFTRNLEPLVIQLELLVRWLLSNMDDLSMLH